MSDDGEAGARSNEGNEPAPTARSAGPGLDLPTTTCWWRYYAIAAALMTHQASRRCMCCCAHACAACKVPFCTPRLAAPGTKEHTVTTKPGRARYHRPPSSACRRDGPMMLGPRGGAVDHIALPLQAPNRANARTIGASLHPRPDTHYQCTAAHTTGHTAHRLVDHAMAPHVAVRHTQPAFHSSTSQRAPPYGSGSGADRP